MNTPDHEPVAQTINSILNVLDEIAGKALNPDTYDEIAGEERSLGKILSRTQLILSFIDASRTPKSRLKVVK